nr:DUF3239 domain-containing protein [Corynebacterium lactis]
MSFHFPVDIPHTKANNEYYRDTRRLIVSSGVFSGLLVIGAVLMILFLDRTPWVIGGTVVMLAIAILYIAVTFQVRRSIKEPQELYDSSPLAPAAIAEVNERTMVLMTLVDVRKDTTVGKPAQALAIRTVTSISGVPRRVGARVPSIAVAGAHKTRTPLYDEVTPLPLAWSTRDKAVIGRASREIPQSDWALLEANLSRVDDVRATKRDLLLL